MADRIRAAPPPTEPDRWQRGTVREVTVTPEHRYAVVVDTDAGKRRVTVSEAIYELFCSRLEATEPVGATAWVR